METVEVKEVKNFHNGVQPVMDAQIRAISAHYANRGLAKAVAKNAQEQIKAEEATTALAPVAYRMSALSDSAVTGLYRHGKKTMSGKDLLSYIGETRQRRIHDCDFSEEKSIYETANPNTEEENEPQTALVLAEEKKKLLSVPVTSLPRMAKEKLKTSLPEWFQGGSVKAEKNRKKFPFSAFAAMIAVAVSLMLIVASSVMLTRAESRINELTLEADALSDEIAELHSDIDVSNDLLHVREIAMDQFGMVDEAFVKMTYLENQNGDTIEAYEEEREDGIGLSALLSAMGIKD